MKELLKQNLWRMLLILCLLTAAAAYLRFRLDGETLPIWVPGLLILWCFLLGLTRRVGSWGPAALCLLALSLCLLSAARTMGEELPDLAGLTSLPAFLPAALALGTLPLWYAPDSYGLRMGAAAVWLGVWLLSALRGWELPRLTVAAMLPLPLLAVCEARFRRLRENEAERAFAPLRGGLCLVLALASLLTLAVPAPAHPYGYPLLRSLVEKAEELWHDLENELSHRREGDLQFGLSFGGLSEQPETEDAAGTEGQSCLHVQPFTATEGPLYLFGNAWDSFDGRSWSQAETDAEDRALLWNADTLEHVYALWRWQNAHGGEDDERFFRRNHIYISYSDMNTRTLFSAADAVHFYFDEDRYPITGLAGGVLFDYMQDSDVGYRMYWLEANSRTVEQLIAYSEGYEYDPAERLIWYTLKERYETRFHLDLREGTEIEELLSRRQELIEQRDLDTTGVSARAAALAKEITASCRTDYEKLKAIAAYLQTNYSYTLAPTPVPEGENFLDWLLFETKEGYCTWYATAAALLGRAVGIPTRYVQGYRAGALPIRRFTTLGPEAAHAWCEGCVAGYGWVTVEATPGFSATGRGWTPPGEEDRAALPEDDLLLEAEKGHKPVLTDEAEDTVEVPGTQPETEAEAEPEAAESPRLWYLALVPPALGLLVAGLWLLRRQRERKRYLAAPPEEQTRQDLGRLLGYLRRRGYEREPEESVRAYFESTSWRYLPAERDQALAMADFYERVLFGGHVPTPEEMAAERAFVAAFRPRRRFFR